MSNKTQDLISSFIFRSTIKPVSTSLCPLRSSVYLLNSASHKSFSCNTYCRHKRAAAAHGSNIPACNQGFKIPCWQKSCRKVNSFCEKTCPIKYFPSVRNRITVLIVFDVVTQLKKLVFISNITAPTYYRGSLRSSSVHNATNIIFSNPRASSKSFFYESKRWKRTLGLFNLHH